MTAKTKEDSTSYIKVCVRLRPLTRTEFTESVGVELATKRNDRRASFVPAPPKKTVAVVSRQVLMFDPSDVNKEFVKGVPTHSNKRVKDIQYAFDRVFAEESTQLEVYNDTVKDLLDGVMDGLNATVFAYGATGAGKTHTISGNKSDPGVMPLCMVDLFERIEKCRESNTVDITVSYLEVYNETIRDLLQPSAAVLDMREDSDKKIVISGLSQHSPRSYGDLMHLMDLGDSNRTKNSTKANEASSRSHGVFQITVQQRSADTGTVAHIKTATLTLCDLAGSERASVTDNRGSLLREGANINRSLLALGNCINALCDEKKSFQHIPFRDSKLTRLLKYSLGGNCRTVMIANVSPALIHYEETHNTLKYAWRAKKIKLNVHQNTLNVDYHIGQYSELISSLQDEVAQLKQKLATVSEPVFQGSNDCLLKVWDSFESYHREIFASSNMAKTWSDIYHSTAQTIAASKADANARNAVLMQHISDVTEYVQALDIDQMEFSRFQVSSMLVAMNEHGIENKDAYQVSKKKHKSPGRRVSFAFSANAEARSSDLENDLPVQKNKRRVSFMPPAMLNHQIDRPEDVPIKRKNRRKSQLPLMTLASVPETGNPKRTHGMQTRRQSHLPLPPKMPDNPNKRIKSIPKFPDPDNNENQAANIAKVNLAGTPRKEKELSDELDDIDSFLNANADTPMKQQPPKLSMPTTPRELKDYVSRSFKSSPMVQAMPFSPARARRKSPTDWR